MSYLAQGVDIGKAFKIGGEGIADKEGYGSIGAFVSGILPNVFILAAIILFFLIIFGGFSIIKSAGDPEKAKEGKQALTAALIGFLVIFASYWIIQIIEVLTGVSLLNPSS